MLLEELAKQITKSDLDQLEYYLDTLYAENNIDFEFTRHFLDRVNDPRNRQQITIGELSDMFTDMHKKYGKSLSDENPGLQAVMRDMDTNINCPFVLVFDRKSNMLQLVTKTTMRKKNFKTSNRTYDV